jgi:very-short-patch-repair endonuclease
VVVRGQRARVANPAAGRWASVPEDILWAAYLSGVERGRWPGLRGLQRQVVVPLLGYRLDFGIAARRVGVEVDGLAFHGGQEAWAKDHQRQRRIEAAGWRVVRFTAREAAERPTAVLDEVERLWGRTGATR